MQWGNLDGLRALVVVGHERSFTKTAAKLGISRSALSQTVHQLEARLGVRLLTRTTRSVSSTEAGDASCTPEPRFGEIDAEPAALSEFREKPACTIRITAGGHAVKTVLWPRLALRTDPPTTLQDPWVTTASTCISRLVAGCMHGSSNEVGAN